MNTQVQYSKENPNEATMTHNIRDILSKKVVIETLRIYKWKELQALK